MAKLPYSRLQIRRGSSNWWKEVNPTLYDGEFGLETDTNQMKIGNGTDPYNSLDYFASVGKKGKTTGEIFNDYEFNTADGEYAHAEGRITHATGDFSHTENIDNHAYAIATHVEGGSNNAYIPYSHIEGTKNQTLCKCFLPTDENVTNKTITLNSVEGIKVGDIIHLFTKENVGSDEYVLKMGTISSIEGNTIKSSINASYTNILGLSLPIEKPYITNGVVIIGDGSIGTNYVELDPEKDFYVTAHAEGSGTRATIGGHSEGTNTIAGGFYSHAVGQNSMAIGDYSYAGGGYAIAYRNYSHAEGYGTRANGIAQFAIGKFNVKDDTTSAFIIGNGSSDSSRSNAMYVDFNGNAYFAGTITAKGSAISGSTSFTGPVSFNGAVTAKTVNVTDKLTSKSVEITDTLTANNITSNGSMTFGGEATFRENVTFEKSIKTDSIQSTSETNSITIGSDTTFNKKITVNDTVVTNKISSSDPENTSVEVDGGVTTNKVTTSTIATNNSENIINIEGSTKVTGNIESQGVTVKDTLITDKISSSETDKPIIINSNVETEKNVTANNITAVENINAKNVTVTENITSNDVTVNNVLKTDNITTNKKDTIVVDGKMQVTDTITTNNIVTETATVNNKLTTNNIVTDTLTTKTISVTETITTPSGEPCVMNTGTYTGTGDNELTIQLGFKPSVVMITCNDTSETRVFSKAALDQGHYKITSDGTYLLSGLVGDFFDRYKFKYTYEDNTTYDGYIYIIKDYRYLRDVKQRKPNNPSEFVTDENGDYIYPYENMITWGTQGFVGNTTNIPFIYTYKYTSNVSDLISEDKKYYRKINSIPGMHEDTNNTGYYISSYVASKNINPGSNVFTIDNLKDLYPYNAANYVEIISGDTSNDVMNHWINFYISVKSCPKIPYGEDKFKFLDSPKGFVVKSWKSNTTDDESYFYSDNKTNARYSYVAFS